MNKVSDWRLVLARSAGPPLVAAAVLALSAASWSQWAAHVFFLVLLVPVTILTIDRVFGGWAALTLGTVVVTLTSWLAVGHPPTTLVSPLGRSAAWVSDAALAQHRWRLPLESSGWKKAWEQTEFAVVRICLDVLDNAQTAGVTVKFNGVELSALERERERCASGAGGPGGPWFRTLVTRRLLESSLESTLEFRRETGIPSSGKMILGHSHRPTAGPNASRYFDGERWHEVDLSPAEAGIQSGRYIVELWLFDRNGRVVMTWY